MIILSNVVNCFSKLLTLHSQGELGSLSSLWMKSDGVTINMKATELYFPFFTVYYVVQNGSSFLVCGRNPIV